MKKNPFKNIIFAFALSLPLCSTAQWLQPNRVKAGLSLGFGGVHTWGKPSFDINWWKFTFRVAPGLHYFSTGATYKIGHYKPRKRFDRGLILSAYYHNDWLLSNKKSNEYKIDRQVYMLMPGIHVNLDHRGTVYFEVSGGLMYAHERKMTWDKEIFKARDYFLPMAEVRLGGIFLSRIEYHQDFPHIVKNPPVHKIKQVRLKAK